MRSHLGPAVFRLARLGRTHLILGLSLGALACDVAPTLPSDVQPDAATSDASPSDAGTPDPDAGFVPGAHEPFPALTHLGGPVLASPRIVTVTFAGYVHEAAVRSFGEWVVGSAWLDAVGADYAIGAGTYVGNVVLDTAAPSVATDVDSRALLTARISDGTLPAPTSDTLYVLYYPTSTVVTDFAGRQSCVAGPGGEPTVGGYHWEGTSAGTRFPYAVLPTCSTTRDALIYLEVSSSHELIEAASDPLPQSSPAWVLADRESSWVALTGENADLCDFLAWIPVDGHWVQPVWSNSAALRGGSPCVPAASGPYFNTSATPSTIRRVARGTSVEVELRGWSDGPTDAWGLTAQSFGDFDARPTLSQTTMQNGGSATLTVSVPAGATAGSVSSVFVYSVRSWATLEYNFWPVLVEAL